MIPYGRQQVDDEDIESVVAALRSDWLTTGPAVDRFESEVAAAVGATHAVAVSSGTAALHAMVDALALEAGDEVIVPSMTFAATANAVVYVGGTPVFADVDPDTLLIDHRDVASRIAERTRAIIAVDYAGQPCDYDSLKSIAAKHGLSLLADGCHALGASHKGTPVGSVAKATTFSFHPVKHITTGEGGIITTDDEEMAARMRRFRNHGMTSEYRERSEAGSWYYEIIDLGYNYRITDFQCALGTSQLRKLERWVARRQEIAAAYDAAFAALPAVRPLAKAPDVSHAYHLYVIRLDTDALGLSRGDIFTMLRERGIGVNVHYIPVHLHPFYRRRFGTGPGLCPIAESAYEQIVSLPMFPSLSDTEVAQVIEAVKEVADRGR